MTERAAQVHALLRTLLHWCPGPPTLRTHALPGFVSSDRPCESCKTNPNPQCVYCGGTRRVRVRDAYDRPTKMANYVGSESQQKRDANAARDATIARLERDQRERAGQEHHDTLTDAIDKRDRLYATGSYAELERALAWLRNQHPARYTMAMTIAYQPFTETTVPDARATLVCETLASAMPQRIRVPAWATTTNERVSTTAKWTRHSDAQARKERDQLIRNLANEGVPTGTIASRLRLDRSTVQRVIRDQAA